ncbi:MAG: HU family DNA-binding protein [Myxococcota bacterium]
MAVTKSELIDQLSTYANLPRGKAEEVINTIFESMVSALESGERIEIRGFGSFEVRNYKSYEGRNPRTGETVHVKPKRLPFFKVGKDLRERINRSTAVPDSDDGDDALDEDRPVAPSAATTPGGPADSSRFSHTPSQGDHAPMAPPPRHDSAPADGPMSSSPDRSYIAEPRPSSSPYSQPSSEPSHDIPRPPGDLPSSEH